LLLAITDQGDGFDHNLVPDPTAGDNLISKHGRGILLVSRLINSLEFRLNGRQLIMRKKAIRSPESAYQLSARMRIFAGVITDFS
jgi:hypothetical protein